MVKTSARNKNKTESRTPQLIVGIGSSAGGVASVRAFLSRLDDVDSISFVLIQHLDDSGESLAHDVLSQQTKFKVVRIADGMKIERGVIYHSPSHTLVSIDKGVFHVEKTDQPSEQFSAIDFFFRSLATDMGERAVAVVLSGEGSDGALGLKAVHDAGGLTLVETPETAEFASMPQNALATGSVDHTLRPADMPPELLNYAHSLEQLLKKGNSRAIHEEITSALVEICDILFKVTRHDFKHYKTSTLVRRIQRRIQVLQLSGVDPYVDRLRADAKEVDALFKELLINVTSFFRDPAAWRTLKESVLMKALKNRKSDQRYRIWVAGCSSGEEAYTLAILVREVLAKLSDPPEVQIIATDIDEAALNQARKGSYPVTMTEHVSAARLKKYFTKKGGRYVVNKELREIVLFSSHNLINDPPFSQIDLISCRNVLIYLGPHLQKKLFSVFHYSLRARGCLLLGNSETLAGHRDLFRSVSAKNRLAQRKATAIRPPGFNTALTHSYVSHNVEATRNHEADIHLVSQRILLDEFAPRYAVVNDEGQIVSVSQGLARYLEPAEGTFQNSLMKLIKPSLRVGFRSTFNEARRRKRQVTHHDASLKIETETYRVGITVQPMPHLGDENGLFMIVFHNYGPLRSKSSRKRVADDSIDHDVLVIEQLERELSTLRNDLDRTVQDLEASNEELKSSNEELLSMNEELQSANEELETSKEEVQSVNDALSRSNTDLENLMASTQIATLFLDETNVIQSFTPQLGSIYNITKVDLGRPISHLTSLAKRMPPLPIPAALRNMLGVFEDDVEMQDGRWVLRRISPYKTTEGRYSGIVVTFIDITHLRQAESARRESESRFHTIADAAPVLIWTMASDKLCDWFNKGWLDWTGRTMDDELGNGWAGGLHPDDAEKRSRDFSKAFERRESFLLEYRLRHHSGDYRWISDRGIPRFTDDGTFQGYIGGCTDIHDRRIALQASQESAERLDLLIRTSPSFMCILSGPDYVYEKVNERYMQLVGYRDILGKSILDARPELRDQGFIEKLDRVRRTGQPFIGTEIPAMLRSDLDGSLERRYLDFVYQPEEQSDGEVRSILVHGNDVTEKVLSRSAIENERANFRNLFKQTPEMVCILKGPEHIFEFVNDAHIRALGFDATGMNVRSAQPESVEVHGLLDDVYRTGITEELREIPVTLGDRVRYFNLTYAARRDEAGTINGVMILGTETTGEVENRAELESARRSAETANESKTRFLANMSHEIRTPLAAIVGYSDLLKGRTREGDGEASQQLDRISRNAVQLGRLLDELLDLSKIEADRFEVETSDFDLNSALEDVFASVSLLAKQRGLGLRWKLADDVPPLINTDATRFKQILTNVIGNAVKFTESGHVDVEFEITREHGKSFLISHVRDTGIGLSPEQQNKIFEPFVQADTSVTRKYGGTGLGLVLSRRLARLLGGDLRLESSTLGEGSTFILKIEIGLANDAKFSATSAAVHDRAHDTSTLAGRRILVVDDSPDNQAIIRLFIQAAGGTVEIAGNGLEAVQKMAARTYDVVLMDIQMPVMDGYQALKGANQNGYRGPIIALTAHAMKEEKDRSLAAGFNGYMSKPIDRAFLIEKLRALTS